MSDGRLYGLTTSLQRLMSNNVSLHVYTYTYTQVVSRVFASSR